MRAVIDTNVIVSAIFFKGKPRQILVKIFEGEIEVICSQQIIEEYVRVIKHFAKKYGNEIGDLAANSIIEKAKVIRVTAKGKYSRDPDDDKFINCALNAKAEYLVSGDKDLLVLEKIKNIEIISPKEFLSNL